jgi:arylsulfatase A-like enzyme
MKKRHWLLFLLPLVAAFTAVIGDTDRSGDLRPNVILILADDLGYNNLGSYGQEIIQTPELDRMAEEGLRFTRFYAGAPLCLPSRSVLMTGLHMGHTRVRKNGGGGRHAPVREEDTVLSEVFKAAGYRTAMLGKWALGDLFLGATRKPSRDNFDGPGAVYKHSWDYYLGEPNQSYNHSYFPDHIYEYDPESLMGAGTPINALVPYPMLDDPETPDYDESYTTDVYIKQALTFIDLVKDEPFFLYLPIQTPHFKFEVPSQEPYALGKPWSNASEKHGDAKSFASMITRMDRGVGKILDRLKDLGIDDDTLVIFTSDNGGLPEFDSIFDNNGSLPGFKKSLSEGGLRVPCIAWWPGSVNGGQVSEEKLYFPDFMPTFAALIGVRPPEPIDGISFLPTLLGEAGQQSHQYLFFLSGSNTNPQNQDYYIVRGSDEVRSDAEIYAAAFQSEPVVPRFDPVRTGLRPRSLFSETDPLPSPDISFQEKIEGGFFVDIDVPAGLSFELEGSPDLSFPPFEEEIITIHSILSTSSEGDVFRFALPEPQPSTLFFRINYSGYQIPERVEEVEVSEP